MSFPPVYDSRCTVLILGTYPSPKSREVNFYYGHPQNRFWPLLAKLCHADLPQTVDEKRALLLDHRIALWDVCESCEIKGADDSTIKKERMTPNDIAPLFKESRIEAIYCNGSKAYALFQHFFKGAAALPVFLLPSTSPANAAYSIDRLAVSWKIIFRKPQ